MTSVCCGGGVAFAVVCVCNVSLVRQQDQSLAPRIGAGSLMLRIRLRACGLCRGGTSGSKVSRTHVHAVFWRPKASSSTS
jgi:hypothetical protein